MNLQQRKTFLRDIVAHTSVAQVEGSATYEFAILYSGSDGMAEDTAVRLADLNPGKIATIFGTDVAHLLESPSFNTVAEGFFPGDPEGLKAYIGGMALTPVALTPDGGHGLSGELDLFGL